MSKNKKIKSSINSDIGSGVLDPLKALRLETLKNKKKPNNGNK